MRFKLLLLPLLILLALAIFFLVGRPPRISVVAPVRGPAVEAVYATGTVEPTVMVPIAPRISARIKELGASEGALVKAGDLLVKLDDDEAQANLNELTTQEELAKLELDRLQRLISKRVVSQSEVDRAQSQLLATHSARRAAEVRVEYLTLLSPSAGLVIRRDGEVGELVPVNQPIYWLSGQQPLRITAEVDEEDVARVSAGQRVLIRADAFPGEEFEGQVESVTPKGDPVSRSFRVRISFAQSAPLRIGMTAETNIIIRETNQALLLPSTAVVGNKVWKVAGGRLQQQVVKIGARGEKQLEIVEGVSLEELVAVEFDSAWVEGQSIREKLRAEFP